MILAKNEGSDTGVKLNGRPVDNLRFAADTKERLQDLTNRVDGSIKRMGLKINAKRTKTMTMGKQLKKLQVRPGGVVLEQVTSFVYLGELITGDGRSDKDVKRRIGLARTVLWGLG